MIEGKAALVLPYLGLLVAVCAWPFLLRLPALQRPSRITLPVFGGALVLGAAALVATRGMPGLLSPVVLALVLLLPLRGPGAILAGLACLPLLAGSVWWAPDLTLDPARAALFVAVGLGAAVLPRLLPRAGGLPSVPSLAVLAGLGTLGCLLLGGYSAPSAFWALWHHWGAFVAPADALLGGGVPFRDFPVQYGMGPTLIIAALSGGDAWPGMYAIVVAANLAYLLCLGGCVLLLTRDAPRGVAALALAAMAAAVLLWTGYPPDFMSWMVAPSVSGLRFLPLAVLVLHILHAETQGAPPEGRGHAIWFVSLAWSPEAAFYATLLWWPYLAIRRAQLVTGLVPVALALGGGALRAVLALLAGLGVMILAFRLGFGAWPASAGFLTYVRNPPGILWPNPTGPIWLPLLAVAGGLLAMSRADPRGQRVGFVCTAALVAVGAYYLGRSHDNNVLNLFPFLVLALLPLLAQPAEGQLSGLARSLMAGLLAWTASFGLAGWGEAARAGQAWRLGPAALLEDMTLATPAAQARLDAALAPVAPPAGRMADAAAALDWLRSRNEGPPLLVNPALLQVRGLEGPAWTGMSNLSTYGLLPAPVVERFIRRGALAYRRPGWMLVDRAHPGPWLDLFRTAYEVTEQRDFGGFTAYRLVPR